MKNKFSFLAIIVAVLCMGTADAQITPSTRRVLLTGNDRAILDKRISKYTAFTMDKKELTDNLYGSGGAKRFRLRVDETLDWTIDLELNDMRAPGYRATYTTDEGTFEVKEPFVVNTFKGRTSDGHNVRFTIDENTFSGVILGDNYHYVIRPASDYTQNREDKRFIVYKSWDIIPDNDHVDYINDALEVPKDGKNKSITTGMTSNQDISYSTASSTCPNYYLSIATDADFEFHQAEGGTSGSSDAPTRNHILSVLNIVSGVYESTFGLEFRITFQHVYTTNSQPYTSTNSITLLGQFRDHWNSNHSESRNIAHLFTGKNLDGDDVGRAYIGALHSSLFPGISYAYGLSMSRTNMYQTTAHEIGHNLNANHPTATNCECGGSTASVMCQGSKRSDLWFCPQSINEISSFLQANHSEPTGICGPIGPYNPVCSDGSSFELVSPPAGTVTWVVTGPFSFSPTASQASKDGNPVTVYRTGTGTGNGLLTAITTNGITAIASITPCPPPPPVTISGPIALCSSSAGTFTATNWQTGYTWDKSSNLTINSGQGTHTVTVSRTASSGTGWISVKQGTAELVRHNLYLSTVPVFSSIEGPDEIELGSGTTTHYYYANFWNVNSSPTTYSWSIGGAPSWMYNCDNYSYYSLAVYFAQPATYVLSVSAQNACGSAYSDYSGLKFVTVTDPSSGYYSSSAYPNPTSNILNIEIDASAISRTKALEQTTTGGKQLKIDPAYDIRLYDGQGNLLRNAKTKGGTVQFNVANLPNGIYYLHIYDGVNAKPEMRQIVVEH